MNNEQLNSNLNELIKNQIEICEKLDKMSKRIKKISKPKKESNYELKGGVFAKGADSKSPFVCAGESIISKKQSDQLTPKQDQKYYLCIKDYVDIVKNGTILKDIGGRIYIKDNLTKDQVFLCDINSCKDYFIPIQQFETLKEGQEIEFTLRNGKTYKGVIYGSIDNCLVGSINGGNSKPFLDLNQDLFYYDLCKKYKHNESGLDWPEAPTLEDLTNDINKLITLPDLSKEAKIDQNESIAMRIKADKLVVSFFDLVNGWQESGLKGEFELKDKTLWNYKPAWKRKAAIMVAIKHCELWIEVAFGHAADEPLLIKSQLQKMLSE